MSCECCCIKDESASRPAKRINNYCGLLINTLINVQRFNRIESNVKFEVRSIDRSFVRARRRTAWRRWRRRCASIRQCRIGRRRCSTCTRSTSSPPARTSGRSASSSTGSASARCRSASRRSRSSRAASRFRPARATPGVCTLSSVRCRSPHQNARTCPVGPCQDRALNHQRSASFWLTLHYILYTVD